MSFDKAQKYENGQDRIFRDPGVTLLQIIYIYVFGSLPLRGFFFRMFHCFCCICHICFIGFHFFHHVSLLFIVFQLFNLILWALIRLKKYENGQDRIFSRPWRDMAPNYIFGSLPLRGFFSVCFIVFAVFFIFLAYQIKPTILLGKSQNIQTCFHHVLR